MKRNYIQPDIQILPLAPTNVLMASGSAFGIKSNGVYTPLDFATAGANAGGGV